MPEAQQSINNNVDKPIVDIDTSGPSVNVALDEKKDETNVEVQEEKITIEETPPKKDELDTVSDGVQKRIDRLTWKVREAERREKAATDYARSVQLKLKENQNKVQQLDEGYVNEFTSPVASLEINPRTSLRIPGVKSGLSLTVKLSLQP